MGLQTVFQTIHQGDLITVDANDRKIYAGCAEPLLARSSKKSSPMKGSPVYRSLEKHPEVCCPPESDRSRRGQILNPRAVGPCTISFVLLMKCP